MISNLWEWIDYEKILPMPLGGYLQGHAKVGELVNGRFDEVTLKEVDSKTDSNSITVTEAKEKELVRYSAMQNGKKSSQADRDRPAPRMSVIVLPNGKNIYPIILVIHTIINGYSVVIGF